jgi:hypothetical protein
LVETDTLLRPDEDTEEVAPAEETTPVAPRLDEESLVSAVQGLSAEKRRELFPPTEDETNETNRKIQSDLDKRMSKWEQTRRGELEQEAVTNWMKTATDEQIGKFTKENQAAKDQLSGARVSVYEEANSAAQEMEGLITPEFLDEARSLPDAKQYFAKLLKRASEIGEKKAMDSLERRIPDIVKAEVLSQTGANQKDKSVPDMEKGAPESDFKKWLEEHNAGEHNSPADFKRVKDYLDSL